VDSPLPRIKFLGKTISLPILKTGSNWEYLEWNLSRNGKVVFCLMNVKNKITAGTRRMVKSPMVTTGQ